MRRYLLIFIFVNAALFIVLVCFNGLVDPYDIFGAPKIAGFNSPKTKQNLNEATFKVVNFAEQQPEIAFIGTSRTDIGLEPSHPLFAHKKTFNLAIAGQRYAQTKTLFDYLATHQTSEFVFGIDFFVANDLLKTNPEFSDNFTPYRKIQLLASSHTLTDSIDTVRKIGLTFEWTQYGRLIVDNREVLRQKGHRQFFLSSEESYLSTHYLPPPACRFDFGSGAQSPMEQIRAIFARAYRENIHLHPFISPSHARQWETLAAARQWDKWEAWKRKLVEINEDEAKKAGKMPFLIWDFSGYNSVSTEAVPVLKDMKHFMRNYFDSSHYTPWVGNMVLDRLFDYHATDHVVPDDFGVKISSTNVEAHLAHIRAERDVYQRAHPNDVAEIKALAGKVLAEKHCRTMP